MKIAVLGSGPWMCAMVTAPAAAARFCTVSDQHKVSRPWAARNANDPLPVVFGATGVSVASLRCPPRVGVIVSALQNARAVARVCGTPAEMSPWRMWPRSCALDRTRIATYWFSSALWQIHRFVDGCAFVVAVAATAVTPAPQADLLDEYLLGRDRRLSLQSRSRRRPIPAARYMFRTEQGRIPTGRRPLQDRESTKGA